MGYPADVDHRINTSAVTADDVYHTRQGEFAASVHVNVFILPYGQVASAPAHFPGKPRGRPRGRLGWAQCVLCV